MDLDEIDYNGECFLTGSAGEREELKNNRRVAHIIDMPFSRRSAFNKDDEVHRNYLELFFRVNYRYILDTNDEKNDNGTWKVPSAGDALCYRQIAYIRTLAARNNHFDFNGTTVQHNTKYTDFKHYTFANLQAMARRGVGDATIVITDLATALAAFPRVENAGDDAQWRNEFRPKYLDAVCLMAYFFRVRGHHWVEEMDDRYKAIWRKCLHEEDTPGIDWEYVAHDALHAIFPDDLDKIWLDAAAEDKCAGALIKRIDSLPAGIAGIAALNAGVADLTLIIPKALDYSKDAVNHLQDITGVVANNRWAGSVNRRFYDAPNIVVNETRLSALAAIIRAGLENLAPASPLLKSKALQRMAANAAMTGSMVGKMVLTAVRSDAAAEIFLPQIEAAGAS